MENFMERMISIFVLLTFTFNVFAQTGSIAALERHLNDFQYAMTVEWDQKDEAFREKATNIFLTNMEKVIKEEGITVKEVEALLEKKMGSKKSLEALKLKLSLAPLKNTTDIAHFIRENSNDLYMEGASWNGVGGTLAVIGVIGGFAAFVALMIWASGPGANCLRHTTEYYCYQRFDESGWLIREDCRDHEICAEYEVYEPR